MSSRPGSGARHLRPRTADTRQRINRLGQLDELIPSTSGVQRAAHELIAAERDLTSLHSVAIDARLGPDPVATALAEERLVLGRRRVDEARLRLHHERRRQLMQEARPERAPRPIAEDEPPSLLDRLMGRT